MAFNFSNKTKFWDIPKNGIQDQQFGTEGVLD